METAENLARKAANLHAFIDQYVPQGRLTGALPGISQDYVKLQEEVMWGGVWQVPGLDVTLRSLATISAQCCNGWGFGIQHQIRVGLPWEFPPKKSRVSSFNSSSTPEYPPPSSPYPRPNGSLTSSRFGRTKTGNP